MSTTDASTPFPVTRKIDIGVDVVEDRLVLVAHTHPGLRVALLTRRVLRNLLAHMAQVLENTGAGARSAGEYRDEVLQMEHLGAMTAVQAQEAPPPPPGGEAGAAAARPVGAPAAATFLTVEVKVKTNPTHLLIGFLGLPRGEAGGGTTTAAAPVPVCAMMLDRADVHRVLALLHDKAALAGWDLAPRKEWMQPPPGGRPTGRAAN